MGYKEGNFELALRHFERAQALYEQADDQVPVAQSLAQILNVIGVLYMKLGDLTQAASSLERSLTIREQGGDPTQIAESLHNLGSVYYKQKALNQTIEKLSLALSIFEKLGGAFEGQIVDELSKLAECYSQVGEIEKSQDCQKRAEQLRKK